jgi:hypothetical protein
MKIEFRNGKFCAIDNTGKVVASSASKYYLKQKMSKMEAPAYADTPAEENPATKFPINQRFTFVKRLVSMVGGGKTASAIITGDGGLGKSHTVVSALKALGLRDVSDIEPGTTVAPRSTFRVVKGYSTAKGLFRILFENRNSIIVFDDCDSILKDEDAVNLLKGALDTYDKRLITWNTNAREDELPRMFEFTGGVVFISNRSINKIDQALRTRSMCIDLSMTLEQKIDRMNVIMNEPSFLPEISVAMKRDALRLIDKHKTVAREVSLRTLIAVTKIRAEGDSDWEDLATYSLVA